MGVPKLLGFSDKINTISGNYNEDDFGLGYDMIFLSAIVHINSDEANVVLIRKCSDALNPGGQIVIQDFIMDDDRVTPYFGSLFALNMLVGTEEGDTYTEDEIKDWLNKSEIFEITRKDTHFGTGLIIGRK